MLGHEPLRSANFCESLRRRDERQKYQGLFERGMLNDLVGDCVKIRLKNFSKGVRIVISGGLLYAIQTDFNRERFDFYWGEESLVDEIEKGDLEWNILKILTEIL